MVLPTKEKLFKHLPKIIQMVESKFSKLIKEKDTLIKNAKTMEWKNFKKYCDKLEEEYDHNLFLITRDFNFDNYKTKNNNKKKESLNNLGYEASDIFELIESLASVLRKSSYNELEQIIKTNFNSNQSNEIEVLEFNKDYFIYGLETLNIAIWTYFLEFDKLVVSIESISSDIEKCL